MFGFSVDMLCDVLYYYVLLGLMLSVLVVYVEEDVLELMVEIGEDMC